MKRTVSFKIEMRFKICWLMQNVKLIFCWSWATKEIGKKEQKIFLDCDWIPFVRLLRVSKNTESKHCRKEALIHFTSCISVHTKEGFSSIPLTVHINVKLLQAEEIFQHYLNIQENCYFPMVFVVLTPFTLFFQTKELLGGGNVSLLHTHIDCNRYPCAGACVFSSSFSKLCFN